MKKLLYYGNYLTNSNSRVLCANKAFYDELKTLLKDFKKIKVQLFEDGESVAIKKSTFEHIDYYEIYTLLKEKEYIFSPEVERFYQYLLAKRDEKANANFETEKIKENQSEIKEVAKHQTMYWCWKYDCQTSLEYCDNCWYKRKYLCNCKPKEIRTQIK